MKVIGGGGGGGMREGSKTEFFVPKIERRKRKKKKKKKKRVCIWQRNSTVLSAIRLIIPVCTICEGIVLPCMCLCLVSSDFQEWIEQGRPHGPIQQGACAYLLQFSRPSQKAITHIYTLGYIAY